jgi:hypothetical protein
MSERSEDAKLAIMIGATIVLVWKTIDFVSTHLTKYIVELWKGAPQEATDIIGFIIVIVIFLIAILVFVIRGRE